ncbi:MAG: ribonuclease P protein component [Flavobacteriales bacterium]|nr:ribonuclease P protein component [Flavobacteriales bacterium]
MSRKYGLPASVRLKHKKAIENLYAHGTSMFQFPILLKFQLVDRKNDEPVVVMFTASKKKLSSAPARNRAKRQMREVFRLSRPTIANWPILSHKQLQLSFIYVHHELLPTSEINNAWLQLIKRMEQQLFDERHELNKI